MRILRTLTAIVLTGVSILCAVVVNGQTSNSNTTVEDELIGTWGMFKDKHPDGWGSFNPPYMYFEFIENNKYNRIWLHRKGNSMIFGEYNIANDSLIEAISKIVK